MHSLVDARKNFAFFLSASSKAFCVPTEPTIIVAMGCLK